jgi:hypothetical protein
MIGVWLTLQQAEQLLHVLKARSARPLAAVGKQIRAQLPTERILPDDIIPEMSIRFAAGLGDVTQDIYTKERADAVWEAIRHVDRAAPRRRRRA